MKRAMIGLIAAAASTLLVGTGTARAGGAEVIIQRGNSDCWVGAADIPGVPMEFLLTNSTYVVTPRGFVNVTCTGRLPEGVSLTSTYTSAVDCYGAEVTQGRITATVSGRVTIVCPQAT